MAQLATPIALVTARSSSRAAGRSRTPRKCSRASSTRSRSARSPTTSSGVRPRPRRSRSSTLAPAAGPPCRAGRRDDHPRAPRRARRRAGRVGRNSTTCSSGWPTSRSLGMDVIAAYRRATTARTPSADHATRARPRSANIFVTDISVSLGEQRTGSACATSSGTASTIRWSTSGAGRERPAPAGTPGEKSPRRAATAEVGDLGQSRNRLRAQRRCWRAARHAAAREDKL